MRTIAPASPAAAPASAVWSGVNTETRSDRLCHSTQVFDRDRWVSEAFRIDDSARADELLDRLGDIPDVGVHAGDDAAVPDPEGDELAIAQAAANDDPVRR